MASRGNEASWYYQRSYTLGVYVNVCVCIGVKFCIGSIVTEMQFLRVCVTIRTMLILMLTFVQTQTLLVNGLLQPIKKNFWFWLKDSVYIPFANCWQFHCDDECHPATVPSFFFQTRYFTGNWYSTQPVSSLPIVVTLTFFEFCSMNAEMNGTLVEVTFKTGLPEIPPGVIKVNRKSNKLEILQCWHRMLIWLLYIFATSLL